MPTRAELEEQLGALEDECSRIRSETAGFKGQVALRTKKLAEAQYRASPAYEQELRGRLLELDHYGLFKGLAAKAGMHAKAIRRGWDMLKQDLGYVINGNPTEPELVSAIAKLRGHADYMFADAPMASAPKTERWLPSGPPVNGHAN